MTRLIFVAVAIVVLFGLVWQTAQAATPITVNIRNGEAFRHVLETGDWLILTRLSLLPTSQTGFADTFSVSITGGDFDEPVVLTNRVHVTGEFSTDVVVTANSTAITSACSLLSDEQTVNCEATGLSNATYTVVVTYRSGWSAYTTRDMFMRVLDGATVVAERNAGRVGCGLVGLYFTAASVTSLGLTWGDSGITLLGVASPVLWTIPSSDQGSITWRGTADLAATKVELRTQLKTMLRAVEKDAACDIAVGTLDQEDFVTVVGTVMAIEAFSQIRTALPGVFASSRINPFPAAITTPTASMVNAIATTVAGTSLKQDVDAIHPMVGILITLVVSVVLGGWVWMASKSQYLSVMVWYITLLGGWLLFGIPFVLVFLPAAGLAALFFMYISKRIFAAA